jgi:hypothetical protein
MNKNFIWKLWLYLNYINKDPRGRTAMVDFAGPTRTLEMLVDELVKEGSDIQKETLLAAIRRLTRLRVWYLQMGYPVNDEVTILSPRVTGNFHGKSGGVEDGDHKITLSTQLTKDTRTALQEVSIEIKGNKGADVDIDMVTDLETGLQDGTITPGDDIIIEGDKIKVVGEPASTSSATGSGLEPGIGVFFVDSTGNTLQAVRYNENNPKRVNVRVPAALPKGQSFTLRIVTRFINGTQLLVTPRTIDYELPVFTLNPNKKK